MVLDGMHDIYTHIKLQIRPRDFCCLLHILELSLSFSRWIFFPLPRATSIKEFEWKVGMTCGGCENAIKRILGKIEPVPEFTVYLSDKRLTVRTSNPDDITEKLKKWSVASGKTLEFVGETGKWPVHF